MNIKKLEKGSKYTGELPKGCQFCRQGRKMVMLVTGLCSLSCFYCPLSAKKKGKDVIYANEKLVENDEDVYYEARTIDALGSGITGGDPLEVMNRTIHYIKNLKKEFGDNHHIHLYTAYTPDKLTLTKLEDVGLDEIRFHIPFNYWDKMTGTGFEKTIIEALKTSLAVGVEVPALPDLKRELMELTSHLDDLGVHFMNLNELEYSETNWNALISRDYEIRHETSNAMKGSQWVADAILKEVETTMALHYCSSRFKDGVQLRRRIKRRAKNTRKESDIITEEGLFIKGIVECDDMDIAYKQLKNEFDIPDTLINIDKEKHRIEIAPWILEEIHEKIKYHCFIVEEYPTADRLEVEKRPLKWPP
ncbi:MAG: 4Fe-4S cluster-binding domain-containing protein [Methanomassiliicoccales archaeon]|nr:MAG: 4Fe-4S cluster-binding domain-containing protein [Methanomassiliicoccales archaeon]